MDHSSKPSRGKANCFRFPQIIRCVITKRKTLWFVKMFISLPTMRYHVPRHRDRTGNTPLAVCSDCSRLMELPLLPQLFDGTWPRPFQRRKGAAIATAHSEL